MLVNIPRGIRGILTHFAPPAFAGPARVARRYLRGASRPGRPHAVATDRPPPQIGAL